MSIADKITSIETHIGDIYDTLEIGGADLTNVNKNIVNINSQLKDRYLDYMNNGTQGIWDNWEKVTSEGTSLTLNNTEQAPIKMDLKGNTSQTGTPTPSSPIPVNVVSGDNSIVVCGKNLIPFTNQDFTLNGIHYWVENGTLMLNGTSYGEILPANTNFKNNFNFVLPAGTYKIIGDSHLEIFLKKYDDDSNILSPAYVGTTEKTFTLSEETKLFFGFYVYQKTFSNVSGTFMISTSGGTYEPYTGATYPINLPEGMELCKIGDYQDYFLHDKTLDKWYLHKEVGKVASYNGETITTSYISTTGGLDTGATVYYVLVTSTDTQITYQPLIEQLNNIEKAMSYNGQTNISQVNNDLPFIINASALKEWSV